MTYYIYKNREKDPVCSYHDRSKAIIRAQDMDTTIEHVIVEVTNDLGQTVWTNSPTNRG